MMRYFRGLFLGLLLVTEVWSAAPSAAPTFYRDIAPIVYQNCSSCHRPGESAPFSLLNYTDVKKHAAQIATVTKTRFMPPWLPEAGYGEFQEERRLTSAQIQLIQAWVQHGALAGRPEDGPAPPVFQSEWELGKPDMILHVKQPYKLGADGDEVFWNFVMPVPVTEPRWVKAMEVRPGNARVFHHANVIIDRSGSTVRKEVKPGAGFPGMDLSVEEDTFDPDGHFLSWKPGSPGVVEPDGMAWRADPGMNLVLNVHMKRSGKEEIVDPVIGLYFTDKPQTKYPLLVQLENDGAINIPPGDKDFLVTDELRLPMDAQVLAVYPHAHYLGKLMEAYATLPDGKREWLIRIPRWDLNWQSVFRLKTPLTLPKDTVISMRYHFDNSASNPVNPNHPPKPMHGGNTALDEMSHFWLQVLPVADGDQRAALQEAVVRHKLEKYPGDFSANFNLGDLMMNQDNPGAAIPCFRLALQADPKSAMAAGELGAALFAHGDVADAEREFRHALKLDPNYIDARYNLASAEANDEEWAAAAGDYLQILAINPNHKNAHQHLGEVLFLWGDAMAKQGDFERAAQHYRDALTFRPDDADLHMHLGLAWSELKRWPEAKAEFESVLKLDPASQQAKDALVTIDARQRLTQP